MRIEAAPAVFSKNHFGKRKVFFTEPFCSEEEAREFCSWHKDYPGFYEFIAWPAKFDAVKGVWYWEVEE